MHTHGDGQHHEPHGGARGGLVWELLDSIMLGAFVIVCGLLAEVLLRAWRERQARIRYDLTPAGRAVTDPHTCTTTTTEALCLACKAEGSPWHREHPEGK